MKTKKKVTWDEEEKEVSGDGELAICVRFAMSQKLLERSLWLVLAVAICDNMWTYLLFSAKISDKRQATKYQYSTNIKLLLSLREFFFFLTILKHFKSVIKYWKSSLCGYRGKIIRSSILGGSSCRDQAPLRDMGCVNMLWHLVPWTCLTFNRFESTSCYVMIWYWNLILKSNKKYFLI